MTRFHRPELAALALLLITPACGLSRGKARDMLMDRHLTSSEYGPVYATIGRLKDSAYEEQGHSGRPSWMGQFERAGFLTNGTTRSYFGLKTFPYSPSEGMKADLVVESGRVKILVCNESVANLEVTGIKMDGDGMNATVEYDLHVAAVLTSYGQAAAGLIPDDRCESRTESRSARLSKYDDGWRL